MIGSVLVGSVLGMLAGVGCLMAGVPLPGAMAAWSGTGALAVLLVALRLPPPRRRPVAPATLRPQRA